MTTTTPHPTTTTIDARPILTVAEAGRRGGNVVKERHGLEYYQRIGKLGGESVKARHGSAYFTEIAQKGAARRHKKRPAQAAASSLVESP